MNIDHYIPEVTSIEEIYPPESHALQKQRWEHLLAHFEQKYGHAASFIARAPGRVNIIGEHIDYMLFPVLPMAVEADLLLAVRITPDPPTIKLSNVLQRFPDRQFPAQGEVEIDATQLDWSNYFKAGYRGAIEFLRRNSVEAATNPPGMEILVDGNVPSGGGLSSSAAFVCASALAGMVSMSVATVDKKELVALAVVSERYVGVNSGGMDQSASVFATAGSALHISFDPVLVVEPVAFPRPEPVFLIANTFKTVEKHVMASVHYNLRVVETTLAAEVVAKFLHLSLPEDSAPLGASLKGLMDTYFAKNPSSQPISQRFAEITQVVEGILHKTEGYTPEEIAEILEIPLPRLKAEYMIKFPVRASTFQLRSRAQHVFGEAARVAETYRLLAEGGGEEDLLCRVGKLMDESQRSCKELYDCSCEELDMLCKLAKEAGAYGSRLTGAGWGGCSVHLVPKDRVEAVRKAWTEGYYKKLGLSEEQMKEAVVESKPGSGTVLFRAQT